MKSIETITITCAHYVDEKGNVVKHSKGCDIEGKTKKGGGGSNYNPDYSKPAEWTKFGYTSPNLGQSYNPVNNLLNNYDLWGNGNSSNTSYKPPLTYKPNPLQLSSVHCSELNVAGVKKTAEQLKNGTLSNLKRLDLTGSELTLEGAKALFDALESPNVKEIAIILVCSSNGQEVFDFIGKGLKYWMDNVKNGWEDPYIYSDTPCLDLLASSGKNLSAGLWKCTGRGIYRGLICAASELIESLPETLPCIARVKELFIQSPKEYNQKMNDKLQVQPVIQQSIVCQPPVQIVKSAHQLLLEQGYKLMTFSPLMTGISEVINMQLGGIYTDINGRTYHRSSDPSNGQFYTKP